MTQAFGAGRVHSTALTLTGGSVKLTGQLLSRFSSPSMPLAWSDLPADVLAALRRGAVIPAHPLALDAGRKLDVRRQKALTRYYIDAGSGGLAVGVHSTQFAIRAAGLYEPVLRLAAETAREWAPGSRSCWSAACPARLRRQRPKRRSRAASAITQ